MIATVLATLGRQTLAAASRAGTPTHMDHPDVQAVMIAMVLAMLAQPTRAAASRAEIPILMGHLDVQVVMTATDHLDARLVASVMMILPLAHTAVEDAPPVVIPSAPPAEAMILMDHQAEQVETPSARRAMTATALVAALPAEMIRTDLQDAQVVTLSAHQVTIATALVDVLPEVTIRLVLQDELAEVSAMMTSALVARLVAMVMTTLLQVLAHKEVIALALADVVTTSSPLATRVGQALVPLVNRAEAMETDLPTTTEG